jgi:syntaxin 5
LTFIIKQDLSRLNEEIRNLQTLSKRLHPKPDQEGENNKNILLLLQGKLGDVSANFKVGFALAPARLPSQCLNAHAPAGCP